MYNLFMPDKTYQRKEDYSPRTHALVKAMAKVFEMDEEQVWQDIFDTHTYFEQHPPVSESLPPVSRIHLTAQSQ